MAKNPMQRKAQNSFLLGMLITLLITGLIIAFLILQLTKIQNETNKLKAGRVSVCVLTEDVVSGQIITEDLITTLEVDKTTIPSNSFEDDVNNFTTYSLQDIAGNSIKTIKVKNNEQIVETKLALPSINKQGETEIDEVTGEAKYRILETEDNINYYYQDAVEARPNLQNNEIETDQRTGEIIYKMSEKEVSPQNVEVKLTQVPIIAKVDIKANSVLTSSVIKKSDKKISNDLRKMEYNMIKLPSQIQNSEYVDVRLRIPNGKDYIVVSNKMINIPEIEGIPSLNTISLEMDETEILTLSCAIVETYKISGAILYVSQYVEPGLQAAATATYIPDDDTINLIHRDPNCVEEARQALFRRNNDIANKTAVRNPINNSLNENSEQAAENATASIEEEIQKWQEERQKYLEALGGTY